MVDTQTVKTEKEIKQFHLDLINKQRRKRREDLIKERRIKDAVAKNTVNNKDYHINSTEEETKEEKKPVVDYYLD